MVTITRRGREVKLKDVAEWYETMARLMGRYPGFCALEQAMFQSQTYKVCIDCLTTENLTHVTTRALIKSTDYYMCQDCLDYWNAKE